MIKWKDTLLMILTLFLLFFIDGWIANTFNSHFYSSTFAMIPQTLLVGLLIYSLYLPVDVMSLLALVYGFIYDSYYIGIIGIYMAGFLIAVTSVYILKKYFQDNILESAVVAMVVLAIFECFVYAISATIGMNTMSFPLFLVARLGPTIVFNAVVFLVLYQPLSMPYKKSYREEKLLELEKGDDQ